jgi:hypothetical protein
LEIHLAAHDRLAASVDPGEAMRGWPEHIPILKCLAARRTSLGASGSSNGMVECNGMSRDSGVVELAAFAYLQPTRTPTSISARAGVILRGMADMV